MTILGAAVACLGLAMFVYSYVGSSPGQIGKRQFYGSVGAILLGLGMGIVALGVPFLPLLVVAAIPGLLGVAAIGAAFRLYRKGIF